MHRLIPLLIVMLTLAAPGLHAVENTLTAEEQKAGWMLLFDGKTLDGWRNFHSDKPSDGWQVRDGAIVRVGRAGNLITEQQFDHFELALQWKIGKDCNSGILFRVSEDFKRPYDTGPEYQILDNDSKKYARDAKHDTNIAGANYAMHASDRSAVRPVGQWNDTRLVVHGDHVEHWLNGKKVVEYDLHSEAWKKALAASKFRKWKHYARQPYGHIAFQDHGDKVVFRNIKIRPLDPPAPNALTEREKAEGWRLLFDGKTLDGWRGYKLEELPGNWDAQDGTIVRTGKGPDLVTKEQYDDFDLMIQWKISPGGNSGILYRVAELSKFAWHTGPEYQVFDSYGRDDLMRAAGACYDLFPARPQAFRPCELWNQTRIIIKDNHVAHYLNGVKIGEYDYGSKGWLEQVAKTKFGKHAGFGKHDRGHIVLQQHGKPVWYRNIMIRKPR